MYIVTVWDCRSQPNGTQNNAFLECILKPLKVKLIIIIHYRSQDMWPSSWRSWVGFSVPFRCLLYNQKCWVALEVYQLIYCCYCVTAWAGKAETSPLTKMYPGSIISALRDIKHNITLSGHTLCNYSPPKTLWQWGSNLYSSDREKVEG